MKATDNRTQSLHEQAHTLISLAKRNRHVNQREATLALYPTEHGRAVLWHPGLPWMTIDPTNRDKHSHAHVPDTYEAQRAWLQAMRARHPLDHLVEAMQITERTWIGWECRRPMPARMVWRLHTYDVTHPIPTWQRPERKQDPPPAPAAEPTKRRQRPSASTRTR